MKTITNSKLSRLFRFLGECENFVFLDTSKPDDVNCRSRLFVEPRERLRFFEGQNESIFLQHIHDLQRRGLWIAGWFSYEFGYLLEPHLKKRLQRASDKGALLADLGAFSKCHTFNHHSGETDFPLPVGEGPEPDEYQVTDLRTSLDEEEYIDAVRRILAHIEAGDTYQVNYTLQLLFNFSGSPEQFYCDLRRNQSVGYGAYIRWGKQRVMSFSPELFFRKDDSGIMVRPMKGTVKRGCTLEEDAANRHFLCSDIKNLSENVMIVDLLRNDLGRLIHQLEDGEVLVESLFDVETYETLLQMTSTIRGRTDRGDLEKMSLHDFFKAIYPCGSVTGAPKIRTMEIIDELEKQRRGVYTGAIGCIHPDGDAVFNVPIRTVVIDGRRGEMGIGSGIVHDSDPQQEWQECLLKGRFLTAPQKDFQLIETLFWHPRSGFFLLAEHLKRLQDSARYFLFFCDIKEIEAELKARMRSFAANPTRIRLLLEKDGTFQIELQDCEAPHMLQLPLNPAGADDVFPSVALNGKAIDSQSNWFYHKTSNRDLYNSEFAVAAQKGLFDTLFHNENGHVTEGCITNLIIYGDSGYVTPPVSDGLLDGVMRSHLLKSSAVPVQERSLTFDDLHRAKAIFLCNSVRGVIRVALSQD
ncbi:aminodeoxychorismate synthase component I [Desulfopila inferna]|uniref:aminodeoxychorismate synthase component I n=1 Tax=Desulfopila inferna TaxID=468528 RepID=UPI0019656148|nr:aminodeoxychorismate synthase component I [Desulfopila inferna]MBM9604394.1 aminodeoxychorismate synthase component I [Desulfopila inferna]